MLVLPPLPPAARTPWFSFKDVNPFDEGSWRKNLRRVLGDVPWYRNLYPSCREPPPPMFPGELPDRYRPLRHQQGQTFVSPSRQARTSVYADTDIEMAGTQISSSPTMSVTSVDTRVQSSNNNQMNSEKSTPISTNTIAYSVQQNRSQQYQGRRERKEEKDDDDEYDDDDDDELSGDEMTELLVA